MSLNFNGVSSFNAIKYNSNDLDAVVCNGVEVWRKKVDATSWEIWQRNSFYTAFSLDLVNSPVNFTGVRVMVFQNNSGYVEKRQGSAVLDGVSWDTNWNNASVNYVASTDLGKYTCILDTGYSKSPTKYYDPYSKGYTEGTPEAVTGMKCAFWPNEDIYQWAGAVFEYEINPKQFRAHVYDGRGKNGAESSSTHQLAFVIMPYVYTGDNPVYSTYKIPGPVKIERCGSTEGDWSKVTKVMSFSIS